MSVEGSGSPSMAFPSAPHIVLTFPFDMREGSGREREEVWKRGTSLDTGGDGQEVQSVRNLKGGV